MAQYDLESLVREFLTDKKVVGLIKLVKPIELVKALVRDLGLCPADAASATLELVKGSDPVQFEQLVREGLPIGSWEPNSQFPVPNKLKKKKDNLEELSPIGAYPDFRKAEIPPEHHRSMPNEFPYDDQSVRWSRVRGQTPKAGHKT